MLCKARYKQLPMLNVAHKLGFLLFLSYSFGGSDLIFLLQNSKGSSFFLPIFAFTKDTSLWEHYIASSFIRLVCSIGGLPVNCGVDVQSKVILVRDTIGAEGRCASLPLCPSPNPNRMHCNQLTYVCVFF